MIKKNLSNPDGGGQLGANNLKNSAKSEISDEVPKNESLFAIEIKGLKHDLVNRAGERSYSIVVDSLCIPQGSFCSVVGPNGCGKTTLLTICGLLRRPSCIGKFRIKYLATKNNEAVEGSGFFDIKSLWEQRSYKVIEALRRETLGFTLQNGGLLDCLTVYENLAQPMLINGHSPRAAQRHVQFIMEKLKIPWSYRHKHAYQLNQGLYQSTVVGRSISHSPSIVFFDEPTASLHRDNARNTLGLLKDLQNSGCCGGATIIMITHDLDLADEFTEYYIRMTADVERRCGSIEKFERSQTH